MEMDDAVIGAHQRIKEIPTTLPVTDAIEHYSDVLSWEQRIQIAIDAVEGLEYLHRGWTLPIIHRDVKTTNILLTEDFRGKIADFGLSRVIPIEGGSHVSTGVAGTVGYLDPVYFALRRLTEKSDVYSFGVVLLEMITGHSYYRDQ